MIHPNRNMVFTKSRSAARAGQHPIPCGAKLKLKVPIYYGRSLLDSLLVFIPVIDQTAETTVPSLLCQFIEHGNKLIHLDTTSHS